MDQPRYVAALEKQNRLLRRLTVVLSAMLVVQARPGTRAHHV